MTAVDASGRAVGGYDHRRRSVRWADRELALAGLLHAGADRRINPVVLELDDADTAEPGLLLLAAFAGAMLSHRDRQNDGL